MIRVLHVMLSASSRFGGPSFALAGYADAGTLANVHSEVLTTDAAGTVLPDALQRAPVHFCKVVGPKYLAFAPSMVRRLNQLAPRFDVIHVHGIWRLHSCLSALAGYWHGVPVVLNPCGSLSEVTLAKRLALKAPYLRLVERRTLQRATLLHYSTPQEQEQSIASRYRANADECSVIVPSPLRKLVRVPAERARKELGIDPGQLVVASVGRGDPIKRTEVLVQALSRMPRNALLVFVGEFDSARRESLTKLATAAGTQDRLRFSGHIEREDLSRWLSAADIFATASAHENFGVAILEACSMELPVILPNDLAIVRELENAVLPVERDPARLAEAVRSLDSAETRRTYGARAKTRVDELYSPEAIAPSLAAMYVRAVQLAA